MAQEEIVITHEDIARARDRARVHGAHASAGVFRRLHLLWLLVGPGILVMLGENDGPSMLSYAATGAKFGIGFFLPFIALTFAMAFLVQEMTVRLGAATHRGHAELIFERFGPFWGWFSIIDLGIGNFLTLITEFVAIRAGLGFFGVPPWAAVLSALALLYTVLLTRRYWTWERITLAIAAFNLVFVPVALCTRPDWHSVAHAMATWKPLPGGLSKDTLLIILADIGATVTPWMLFFQQSATVDKGLTRRDLHFGRIDTAIGAALAALAALGTVIATAPLLAAHMAAENFQAPSLHRLCSQSLAGSAQPYLPLALWRPGWWRLSPFPVLRPMLSERLPADPIASIFPCGKRNPSTLFCFSVLPWQRRL